MEKIFSIINGNSRVTLYKDGSRLVETLNPNDDFLDLKQPLSLDINISNRCSNGCPYCYAGNTPTGKMTDLLDMPYLDRVTGIEIAINIQYPLPENFELWLEKMKSQNIVVSGTINQLDFERDIETLHYMRQLKDKGLLYGIGVSFRKYDDYIYSLVKNQLGNDVVVHVIVGVTPVGDVFKLLDNGFKVLILGYKNKNRGIDYANQVNIEKWKEDINSIWHYNTKTILALDTAGLKQLDVKSEISWDEWLRSYQGDEGTISFYIDAVNKTFNIDSHTNEPPIEIGDKTLEEMFKIIREKVNNE